METKNVHVPAAPAPHDHSLTALHARLDHLSADVAYLVERQRVLDELIDDFAPITKGMVNSAATRLEDLEKRGYFEMGREALGIVERVAEGFTPDDVRKPLTKPKVAPTPLTARVAAEKGPACATPSTGPAAVASVMDGVGFGADGHLADASQWTRALGEKLASMQGVEMSDAHWALVEAARKDFGETKASPNIRRLTQVTTVTTKEVYALFPKAPARTLAKIAGLPKPAGCL